MVAWLFGLFVGYFVSVGTLRCKHFDELHKKEVIANNQYCQHQVIN
jgi:hypothetical protein